MAQLPFKIVAVDMDGTFMSDQQTFDHAWFDQILTDLRANGAHFIISSGRPIKKIQVDFSEYLDRISIVAENGGLIYRDNQLLRQRSLTASTGRKLVAYIAEKFPEVGIFVSGTEGSYIRSSESEEFIKFMTFYYPERKLLDTLEQMPSDERIIKLTLRCPEELGPQIEAGFNEISSEKVHTASSGYHTVDVIPEGVNKADGIKFFLDYFKCSSADLIAFGDDFNDLEMLQLAKYSYLMANGNPKLVPYAKFRAPSNNKNGVLQVLAEYLKQK